MATEMVMTAFDNERTSNTAQTMPLHMIGAEINFAFHFVQMNTKRSNGSFHFHLFPSVRTD